MRISIDDRTVLSTETILVPENSEAWIEFPFHDENVKLHIDLLSSGDSKNFSYQYSGKDDYAILRITNISAPLVFPYVEPIKFWVSPDNKILLSYTFHAARLGNGLKIIIQFLTEPNDE